MSILGGAHRGARMGRQEGFGHFYKFHVNVAKYDSAQQIDLSVI